MGRRDYSFYDREGAPEEFDKIHFGGPVGEYFKRAQENLVLDLIDMENASLLDVGTGTGRIAVPIAGKCAKVVGVDASMKMIERARQRAIGKNNLHFHLADAHCLPFADDSFDYAVSFRTLMHFKNWRQVIGELCRVSRRYVIIDFPPTIGAAIIESAYHRVLHLVRPSVQAYTTFLVSEMKREFRANQFRIVTVERQIAFPFKLHRKINHLGFTKATEAMCRSIGATRLIGSPVLLKAEIKT